MKPPYVGILVNDKLYSSIPLGKTKHEAVSYYVEAGREYGFVPCFFRIQDLRPGQRRLKAWVPSSNPQKFVLKEISSPYVIHNRAIYSKPEQERRLDAWAKEGRLLFNRWNRYSKLRIHELLMDSAPLRPHLPGSCEATSENITAMMKSFDSLIIKPDRSSIGRGVMKLERRGQLWELTYPLKVSIHNRSWRTIQLEGTQLPKLLLQRLKRQTYLVQQRLPLATYHGRPFDLRVSVQRGDDGKWGVTGIVAKIAPKDVFLTNVATGGSVSRLDSILKEEYSQLNAKQVLDDISSFALRISTLLGRKLPYLADVGLDIGMTEHGYPLFIECNGKDQRYSFHEADMLEEWKATYFKPMGYARYLLNAMDAGKIEPLES